MFVVNNYEKKSTDKRIDEENRLRCPMCKGRGYFDPTKQIEHVTLDEHSWINNRKIKDSNVKLPRLEYPWYEKQSSKQKKIRLPSIINEKYIAEEESVYDEFSNRSDAMSKNEKRYTIEENMTFYSRPGSNTSFSKPSTIKLNSNESDTDHSLLPPPKIPKNPQNFLKSSLIKLKENDWNSSLKGLENIIQISRYQPEMLEGYIVIIYRYVISLLRSFRSQITRTACQVMSELFSSVPNTQRPEFDELIGALLQKTADTNKFVRRDANEALDSMIISVSPVCSVRALVEKGASHRSAAVRAAVTRLLVCLVGLIGVNSIFSGSKETRNHLMNTAAHCVQDRDQDVRNYGCRLMKALMKHEDFDEILQGNVDSNLISRIEKVLITIKYQK